MNAALLGGSELPPKILNAATIKTMRASIATRSICLGSCPWWLIFQRIFVSPDRIPNQCGSSVAVPRAAAMRPALGSSAAEFSEAFPAKKVKSGLP
jgi:hypothetical protein